MLIFKNVVKSYSKDVFALNDVNMHIRRGDFVFLVGPNGAGKSTMLRLITCEESPSAGEIYFNGASLSRLKLRQIPFIRRQMGIVFQDFKLLANLTVFDNIAFALRVLGLSKDKVLARVEEVLEIVGMTHRKNYYPQQLSGGEQQRTAIGRALANWPMLILADEPTGNLDPAITKSIMKLFSDINRSGTTIVMATHDRFIVNQMQRRVITLDDGRVVRDDNRGGYQSGI